jgi:hypothetical protein
MAWILWCKILFQLQCRGGWPCFLWRWENLSSRSNAWAQNYWYKKHKVYQSMFCLCGSTKIQSQLKRLKSGHCYGATIDLRLTFASPRAKTAGSLARPPPCASHLHLLLFWLSILAMTLIAMHWIVWYMRFWLLMSCLCLILVYISEFRFIHLAGQGTLLESERSASKP